MLRMATTTLMRRQTVVSPSRITRRHGSGGGGSSGWSLLESSNGPDKSRWANADLTGPASTGQVTGDLVGISGWKKYYIVGILGVLSLQSGIDSRKPKHAAHGHDHGHEHDGHAEDETEPKYGGAYAAKH